MTVADVIARLQQYPADAEVVGYWDSYCWSIRAIAATETVVALDVSSESDRPMDVADIHHPDA